MLSPLPLNAPPKDAVLLSRVSITTCDTSDNADLTGSQKDDM